MSGARPALDKLTDSIGQSLSAYVASGILNELEWAVTRAENMDVKSFQAKKGKDLWCTFPIIHSTIQKKRPDANIFIKGTPAARPTTSTASAAASTTTAKTPTAS